MRERLRVGLVVGGGLCPVVGCLVGLGLASKAHFVHAQLVFEALQSEDCYSPGRNDPVAV